MTPRSRQLLHVPASEVLATIEALGHDQGLDTVKAIGGHIGAHTDRDSESVQRGLRQMRLQQSVSIDRAEGLLIGLGATAHALPSYRRAMNQFPPPVHGWCPRCAERVMVDGQPLRCLWCGAKASRIERAVRAA